MNRSEQDYTDLIADARVWPRDGVSKGPLINALADAIEALVKERDEQGSCWDEGMTLPVREGGCAPMPPKCELPHGHGGAHRAGRVEWMRRDSYNSVVAERDELKREMHARELHHFEEEQKSAELAAVIDELRQWAAATRYKVSGNHDTFDTYHEGIDRAQGEVEGLISEVPADALRAHDAALIDSLADEEVPAAVEARRWLRDRARQVREGEA